MLKSKVDQAGDYFSWLWEKLKKRRRQKKLIQYLLPRLLFAICAPLTATKGFFSIPALVVSLGAISFLSFFTAIPSVFITAIVLINVAYSLIIEQPIYYRPFITLYKQIFGKTKKLNDNIKTKSLTKENDEIRAEQSIPASAPNKPIVNLANKSLWFKARYFLQRAKYYTQLSVGYSLAFFIVALRTIESSGRNTLGLMAIVLLFTATPASGFVLLFTFTSIVGYCINNSQQLMQQWHETLKILFFKRFTKDDYKKELRERNDLLRFKSVIETAGSSPTPGSDSVPEHSSASPENKSNSKWKKGLYYLINICFWIGAAGGSAAGFFTINKFFFQMKGVAFLGFFALTPPYVAFTLALIMTIYMLYVEKRKVLYPYFSTMCQSFLGLGEQKDKPKKDPAVKIANLEEKISAILKLVDQERGRDLDTIQKLNEQFEQIRTKAETSSTNKTYHYSKPRLFLSKVAAGFILFLRAITSIGAPALGLDLALKTSAFFIAKLLGISLAAFLGPWTFFPCLIIASLDYLLKFSRNAEQQWISTLDKVCGIKSPNNELDMQKKCDALKAIYSKLLYASRKSYEKIRFTKEQTTEPYNGKVLTFYKITDTKRMAYNTEDAEPCNSIAKRPPSTDHIPLRQASP